LDILIIYFSQTGGTEKIAMAIQKGVVASGNACEIATIKNVDMKKLRNYDLIGIGCPTFYYREPLNVRIFIQKMEQLEGKHCFIFVTHGSCLGNTFYYLQEDLNRKGLLVIRAFDSYSESSLQFYPKLMHTTGHPDQIELQEAHAFGAQICTISSRIKKGESQLIPQFGLIENTWWARDSKRLLPPLLRKISPPLKINMDICTKCLICQNNCPVDAINIEASPPEIQKEGCIFCWFCEKSCPLGAIEADWSSMRANSRSNLKLYVKLLKEAEKLGKFRPYIDYEKIV
jgi:flavodoxin/Fe-S-cluster-containing hydrogenase component 2